MFQYSIVLPLIYQVMLQMHKTIISDTSCFIILSKIEELDLLQKLYGQIVTTLDIAEEFGEKLPAPRSLPTSTHMLSKQYNVHNQLCEVSRLRHTC
jgi:predicted nucleic acid-binding protein